MTSLTSFYYDVTTFYYDVTNSLYYAVTDSLYYAVTNSSLLFFCLIPGHSDERRVIIISTVRSTTTTDTDTAPSIQDVFNFDSKHNLGFLSNPKRFNVAVTRAKALVIVVGNPYIMASDPSGAWKAFLNYCFRNRCYIGQEYKPSSQISDVITAMKNLFLDQQDDVREDEIEEGYICVRGCIYICIHLHIHTHILSLSLFLTHTRTHTHTHIYIRTHIYIYILLVHRFTTNT